LLALALLGITEGRPPSKFWPQDSQKEEMWYCEWSSQQHHSSVLERQEGSTSHPPAAEGNFWYKSCNALKPQLVRNCDTHTRYVDKSDRIAKS
jgi:hypothetical protein